MGDVIDLNGWQGNIPQMGDLEFDFGPTEPEPILGRLTVIVRQEDDFYEVVIDHVDNTLACNIDHEFSGGEWEPCDSEIHDHGEYVTEGVWLCIPHERVLLVTWCAYDDPLGAPFMSRVTKVET